MEILRALLHVGMVDLFCRFPMSNASAPSVHRHPQDREGKYAFFFCLFASPWWPCTGAASTWTGASSCILSAVLPLPCRGQGRHAASDHPSMGLHGSTRHGHAMAFFVPRPCSPWHRRWDLHTRVEPKRTCTWIHARPPMRCVRATMRKHVASVRARVQRRDASDRGDSRTESWDVRLSRALQVARVVDDEEERSDASGSPSHVQASLPARKDAWTRALVALRTVASAGAEWEMAMDAVERAELLDETLLEAARARLEVESSRRDPERTRAFELLVRAIAARYARKEATRSMKLLDELMRESPKEAAKKLKRALMDEAWDRLDVPAHWEHADVFRIASETARKARQNPKPSAQPKQDVVKIPPREFVGEVQTLWDSLDPEQKNTDAGIKVMKILRAARALLERMEEEGMEEAN